MTKENTPLALLNIDKAKGLQHLHGHVTNVNTGEDDTATSTSDDPDNKDTHAGNPNDNKPQTSEDETYKKRWSDLKTYHDSEVTRLRKENEDLKRQQNSKPLEIPKTPEEALALRNKYPELVDTMISIQRMDLQREREIWQKELEAIRAESAKAKAETDNAKILKAHPDAEKISKSPEFAEWFSAQPKGIRALFESEDDVYGVIKGFSLYKADKGIKNTAAEAAQRVKTGTKTDPDPEKRVFYESQVAAMSDREYSRLEKEILAARMDGRLLRG